MKMPFKMLVCAAAAATVAFWSCDINVNVNNSDDNGNANNIQPEPDPIGVLPAPMPLPIAGAPAMDSRAVSYKMISLEDYPEWRNSDSRIITDKNALKLWFPNIFNGNQKDECNYFAVYSFTSSSGSGYKFISEDMRFCSLVPNPNLNDVCMETTDFVVEAILACDDKAGTLQTHLQKDMESRALCSYVVQDWDCHKNTPEKLFF